MNLVVFERPNNQGLVTINTALVKKIQASTVIAPHAATTLIFDEDDHFDVVGDLVKVAKVIGVSL